MDAEGLGEAAQPAGVLGGDDVGALQLGGEPGRGVGGVADGGACEYEGSGSCHGSILAAARTRARGRTEGTFPPGRRTAPGDGMPQMGRYRHGGGTCPGPFPTMTR